jgi:hypothetical protein
LRSQLLLSIAQKNLIGYRKPRRRNRLHVAEISAAVNRMHLQHEPSEERSKQCKKEDSKEESDDARRKPLWEFRVFVSVSQIFDS